MSKELFMAAHDELMRKIQRRNEVAKELAIHNTPKDPTDDAAKTDEAMETPGAEFQTKAQALGAKGGRQRAANRVDTRESG